MDVIDKIKKIRMILSDVDGVLTDGGIIYDNQSVESKKFHVRDGLGIKLWRMSGGMFGIVTARESEIVKQRAAELKIEIVCQGSENKAEQALAIVQQHGLMLDEVCYIGDDLTDLPLLRKVGLAACVSDAAEELVSEVDLVTDRPGGYGAVRELIETVLKGQDRWQDVLQVYLEHAEGKSQ